MIVPLTRRRALGMAAWLTAMPALAQIPILPDAGQLRPGQYAWQPETAPSGPLLVLVSLTEQVARVYRNGIEIGQAVVGFARPEEPLLPAVFTILERPPRAGTPVWAQVGLFHASQPGQRSDVLDRLSLPPAFSAAIRSSLVPGTSLYCALGSATPDTRTDPAFTVVAARPS